MQASVQDRLLSALGTALILMLLGYLLFIGMAVRISVGGDRPLTLVAFQPPAPPPRPKPRPVIERPSPSKAADRAAPRNLRNKATAILAPPPTPITLPTPVITAPIVGPGMANAAGASDRPGPGTGAGGAGDGTGGGGSGDGDGDVGPEQVHGRLKSSDLPPDLRAAPFKGTVSVDYSVETDGRVGECRVTRSSGSAELDALTCQLIQQRFRFRPAHDRDGHPFRSTVYENHYWQSDGEPDTQRP